MTILIKLLVTIYTKGDASNKNSKYKFMYAFRLKRKCPVFRNIEVARHSGRTLPLAFSWLVEERDVCLWCYLCFHSASTMRATKLLRISNNRIE